MPPPSPPTPAHDWDVQRAITYFLEQPPDAAPSATAPAAAAGVSHASDPPLDASAHPENGNLDPDAVYEDDYYRGNGAARTGGPANQQYNFPPPYASTQHFGSMGGGDEDDLELQRALAMSLGADLDMASGEFLC